MVVSESLNLEIWDRLIQNRSLEGLSLERCEGRVDIRGLKLPEPAKLRQFTFKGHHLTEVEPAVRIDGASWKDLDFSESSLKGLRITGSRIDNCCFDNCDLRDARVWATSIRNSTFKRARLKAAVLGGVQDDVRNAFTDVDFSDADLSETVYKAAAFERCLFHNSRLFHIDFQGSTFIDCRFEGELRDVLFYRTGFKGEKFPPNEMINVDFTRARLRAVGFRNLKLDRVHFPNDDEHVVINDFAASLDRMATELGKSDDTIARKLLAFIRIDRKWTARQVQGVINLQDMEEVVGKAGVERFRRQLR